MKFKKGQNFHCQSYFCIVVNSCGTELTNKLHWDCKKKEVFKLISRRNSSLNSSKDVGLCLQLRVSGSDCEAGRRRRSEPLGLTCLIELASLLQLLCRNDLPFGWVSSEASAVSVTALKKQKEALLAEC